jgi:hypothetical protein
MKDQRVYGMYNKWGYRVCTVDGDELYTAGNSPHDSGTSVDDGLPLRKLRSMCIRTAKEIAAERGVDFIDVERIEDED